MDAQNSQQDIEQFRLGQRVGDCLVKGCVALLGTIASVGAPRQEPGEPDPKRAVMYRDIKLTVTEWLHGKGEAGDVQVLAASEPEFSKTGHGPWQAWEGVTLEPVRHCWCFAGRQTRPGRTGMAPGRMWRSPSPIAGGSTRFARGSSSTIVSSGNQARFRAAVRLFQEQTKADPLVKGYVLTYLMDAASVGHLDATAKVLAAFLADDGLPNEGRPQIADWLASSFYRLDEPTRKTVTETLVASAGADDPPIADAALTVLIRLSDLDMLDMKAFLTPATPAEDRDELSGVQGADQGARRAWRSSSRSWECAKESHVSRACDCQGRREKGKGRTTSLVQQR